MTRRGPFTDASPEASMTHGRKSPLRGLWLPATAVTLAGLLLTLLAVPTTGRVASRQPSATPIFLISLDTLRAADLGSYGSPWPSSPFLDRLSREFHLFVQCVAPAPWTAPSHMSILTSQYPNVHQVTIGEARLTEETLTLPEVLAGEGWLTQGFYSNGMLSPKFGFDQGFHGYRLTGRKHGSQATQAALKWLKGLPRDRTPFLFLHYNDPHIPYQAPDPYHRLFDPHYTGSMNGRLRSVAPFFRSPIPSRELQHLHALYREEVRYVDHQLGKVLRRLKALDLYDGSLIIVTADHGEEFKEHGSLTHNQTLYEELLRVPLMIKLPRRMSLSPRLIPEQVRLIDLMPTILDVAGLPIPEDSVQGASLMPLIRELPEAERVHARNFSETRETRAVCLRGPHWKYVYHRQSGKRQLFDLQQDPAELKNLVEREPELAEQLHQEVLAYIHEAKDGWHLRLRAPYRFHGRLETSGRFVDVQPFGAERDVDRVEVDPRGRWLELYLRADSGQDQLDGVRFELEPPDADLRLHLLDEDPQRRDEVLTAIFIGEDRSRPAQLPVRLNGPDRTADPNLGLEDRLTLKFINKRVPPGVYIWRTCSHPAPKAELDEDLREELRSLGYLEF